MQQEDDNHVRLNRSTPPSMLQIPQPVSLDQSTNQLSGNRRLIRQESSGYFRPSLPTLSPFLSPPLPNPTVQIQTHTIRDRLAKIHLCTRTINVLAVIQTVRVFINKPHRFWLQRLYTLASASQLYQDLTFIYQLTLQ